MLELYGKPTSINVRKVLWLAAVLGQPLRHHVAPAAELLRGLNPNAQVPVLREGDFVLWESNAIVRYLAARYAEGSLWPRDVTTRASADRWMDWTTSTFAAPFRDVFWGMVRTAPEARDMAVIDAAREKCAGLLATTEQALAERPYLSGDSFGMGDIPLGCFAHSWFAMPIARPDLPHLAAWYERLKARPAYAKVVATPLS